MKDMVAYMEALDKLATEKDWGSRKFAQELLGFFSYRQIESFTIGKFFNRYSHHGSRQEMIDKCSHYYFNACHYPGRSFNTTPSLWIPTQGHGFDAMGQFLTMNKGYRDLPIPELTERLAEAYKEPSTNITPNEVKESESKEPEEEPTNFNLVGWILITAFIISLLGFIGTIK